MKILVIGMGIVGETTARGFSELGHDVVCRDLNGDRPVSDVCFICTPEEEVKNAIRSIETGCLVVMSTTVPGTIASLGGHICHNPCFITEGTADRDFMHPQIIVIGECCKAHGDILEKLYSGFDTPIFRVNVSTSEMIKLTLNCYLATQIGFWSEIKRVCDKLGISPSEVANICRKDARVSRYITFDHDFGECLPKDLRHMVELFKRYGIGAGLLEAVK